jgi:hypothetical protein
MMDFTAGVPQRPETHKKKRVGKLKRPSNRLLIIGGVVLVVLGGSIGTSIYFFSKYKDVKATNDKVVVAEATKDSVVKAVAKIYAVPNEEPTLARVNNPAELSKDQSFFAPSQEGDYVLVYPKAKLAILYRASEKKIINVGPVSVAPGETTKQGTTQPQQ